MVTQLNDTLNRKVFLLIICMIAGGLFISPVGAVDANFSISDIHGMPGDRFPVGDQLILTGTDNSAENWFWTVDGQSSTIQSWTTDPFDTDGTYRITLRAIGSDGSIDEQYRDIEILEPNHLVNANFSYTIDYAKNPLNITLFDQSETGGESIEAWYWTVDGHQIPDTQLPEFNYSVYDEGSDRLLHISQLIRTAPSYWMDIEEKTINLSSNPVPLVANFTTEKRIQEINAGESIHFLDRSTGSPTSWSWDFGDGETSSLQSPVHVYHSPGLYTVTLMVINGDQTAKKTEYNYIHVLYDWDLQDPSWNPSSGSFPLSVKFVVNALVEGKTEEESAQLVSKWEWNIQNSYGSGDYGVLSSLEKSPVFTFERPGVYEGMVACMLRDGSSKSEPVGPIYVTPMPYADFYWEYLLEADSWGYVVKFYDTSVGAVTWDWDFGDGATSTEQNPTHRFKEADTIYNVTLRVTDINGDSNTRTLQVPTGSGYNKPDPVLVADFTSATASEGEPLTVKFTDISKGNPVSWSWNFGDGITCTDQNPEHEYTTAGTYPVTLTVKNAKGKEQSKTHYVTTKEYSVTPDFVATHVSERVFSFIDTSTGNIVSWSWDFGDGSPIYVGRNPPAHMFPFSNRYYFVTLTVQDGSTGIKVSKTMGIFTGYQ